MIWSIPAVGVRVLMPMNDTVFSAMLSVMCAVTSSESPTFSFAPAIGPRKVSTGFAPSTTVKHAPGGPAFVYTPERSSANGTMA